MWSKWVSSSHQALLVIANISHPSSSIFFPSISFQRKTRKFLLISHLRASLTNLPSTTTQMSFLATRVTSNLAHPRRALACWGDMGGCWFCTLRWRRGSHLVLRNYWSNKSPLGYILIGFWLFDKKLKLNKLISLW